MTSMWLCDSKIKKTLIKGKATFSVRVPEAFMRAMGATGDIDVAVFMENGSLSISPMVIAQKVVTEA